MSRPEPVPFKPAWPDPDLRYLRDELPQAPVLPLDEVFGPRWAAWIRGAAEAKAAPADYSMAALLSAAGTLIGNTRWASPWSGWTEPPIIWSMAIGTPSMNKSPGLDAVLIPLRRVEREARKRVSSAVSEWRDKAEVAKIAEQGWREATKAALKSADCAPSKPEAANPGEEPILPRLSVTDATVEKLAVIIEKQSRGLLLARDELTGWLQNMTRYSGGSSDRPFWLEAYGGRGYSVERMGCDPVYIDHLSVGVLGGIQPDRLRSLLLKTDDDGLLARFVPVYPDPAPIRRPGLFCDEPFIEECVRKLLSLQMLQEETGERPWVVHFSSEARDLLDAFRIAARCWEQDAEGLLLSFTGKLPGLAVRLSLILAYLDWAGGNGIEPVTIACDDFGRAAHLVEVYVLPMARRAYANGSMPKEERAARKLARLIHDEDWRTFSSKDVLHLERAGIATVVSRVMV